MVVHSNLGQQLQAGVSHSDTIILSVCLSAHAGKVLETMNDFCLGRVVGTREFWGSGMDVERELEEEEREVGAQ